MDKIDLVRGELAADSICDASKKHTMGTQVHPGIRVIALEMVDVEGPPRPETAGATWRAG